jgi:hypothetical protein
MSWSRILTWDEVFAFIGPKIISALEKYELQRAFQASLVEKFGRPNDFELDEYDFETVLLQLSALGLVDISESPSVKGSALTYCQITKEGMAYLTNLRVARKSETAADDGPHESVAS